MLPVTQILLYQGKLYTPGEKYMIGIGVLRIDNIEIISNSISVNMTFGFTIFRICNNSLSD